MKEYQYQKDDRTAVIRRRRELVMRMQEIKRNFFPDETDTRGSGDEKGVSSRKKERARELISESLIKYKDELATNPKFIFRIKTSKAKRNWEALAQILLHEHGIGKDENGTLRPYRENEMEEAGTFSDGTFAVYGRGEDDRQKNNATSLPGQNPQVSSSQSTAVTSETATGRTDAPNNNPQVSNNYNDTGSINSNEETVFTFTQSEQITTGAQAGKWGSMKPRDIVEKELNYNWNEVASEFKSVNPKLDQKKLEQWIKKCVIDYGWRKGDAVPDFNEIIVTVHTDGAPVIEAPSASVAWNYAVKTLKLKEYSNFYYKDKITGKLNAVEYIVGSKEVVFNKKYNRYQDYTSLCTQLFNVSQDFDAYDKALKEKRIGEAFVKLVRSAQDVVFYDDPSAARDGLLGNDTRKAIDRYKSNTKGFDPYLESLIRRYAVEKEKLDVQRKMLTGKKSQQYFQELRIRPYASPSETVQSTALQYISDPILRKSIKESGMANTKVMRDLEYQQQLDKDLAALGSEEKIAANLTARYPRKGAIANNDAAGSGIITHNLNPQQAADVAIEYMGDTLFAGRYGIFTKNDAQRVVNGYDSLKQKLEEQQKDIALKSQTESFDEKSTRFYDQYYRTLAPKAQDLHFYIMPGKTEGKDERMIIYNSNTESQNQRTFFEAWVDAMFLLTSIPKEYITNSKPLDEIINKNIEIFHNTLIGFEGSQSPYPWTVTENGSMGESTYKGDIASKQALYKKWVQSKKTYKDAVSLFDEETASMENIIQNEYFKYRNNQMRVDPDKALNTDMSWLNSSVSHKNALALKNDAKKNGNTIAVVPAVLTPQSAQGEMKNYNPASGQPVPTTSVGVEMYLETTKSDPKKYILHVMGANEVSTYHIEKDNFYDCLEVLSGEDILESGTLLYTDPFSHNKGSIEIRSKTKASTALMVASVILAVAATIATGGLATVFIVGSVIAGVASSGFKMYELSQTGKLNGSDVAVETLNIVSNLIPFINGAAKLAAISRTSELLAGTEKVVQGIRYLKIARGIEIASGVADEVMIADDIYNQLDEINKMNIPEDQKNEMRKSVLLRGIGMGLIGFLGLRSSIKEYRNVGKPHITGHVNVNESEIRVGKTRNSAWDQSKVTAENPYAKEHLDINETSASGNITSGVNVKNTETTIVKRGDKYYRREGNIETEISEKEFNELYSSSTRKSESITTSQQTEIIPESQKTDNIDELKASKENTKAKELEQKADDTAKGKAKQEAKEEAEKELKKNDPDYASKMAALELAKVITYSADAVDLNVNELLISLSFLKSMKGVKGFGKMPEGPHVYKIIMYGSELTVEDGYTDDKNANVSKKATRELTKQDLIELYNKDLQGTARLRRGITTAKPYLFQAHHIIPRELIDEFSDFFVKIGFNIENGTINGIMIPATKEVLEDAISLDKSLSKVFGNSAFHLGSHPDYTRLIKGKLIKIRDQLGKKLITEAEALEEVVNICNEAKTAISNGKGKMVNELKF